MPEDMSDRVPEDMPDRMPEDLPDRMPEDMPEDMPDHMPEDMPDRMPNRMSEDMSDRMPEDLPVRKCINVMVGITRSKVICLPILTSLSGQLGLLQTMVFIYIYIYTHIYIYIYIHRNFMMFLSTIRATVLLLALPTLPPKYGWLIIGFTPYQHQVSLSYSIIYIHMYININ